MVAGEASADLHGAHIVEHWQRTAEVSLVGVGGDRLIGLGMKPLCHARQMAVVGLTEALRKIPQTLRLVRELSELAEREKPDCAFLIDLPDFNLRLARRLKALGIPVVYFVSPQVWAWRSNRVKEMAEILDLLLVILPFEKDWYQKNAPAKLNVEYVGHPALEEIPTLPFSPSDSGGKRIALMPGSRLSEWNNLAKDFLEAAALLHRSHPDWEFVLPLAEPLRKEEEIREALKGSDEYNDSITSLGKSLSVVEQPAHEVLRECHGALIASGTATLEAAIVGIPMVVAYRVSAVSAFLFRHLVGYRGPVAMANIIHCGLNSEERLVPELLQEQVSPENLAGSLRTVLASPCWERTRDRLSQTRKILAGPGSTSQNVVSAVERLLEQGKC
jgi:lipid-A-disaccharide synthase